MCAKDIDYFTRLCPPADGRGRGLTSYEGRPAPRAWGARPSPHACLWEASPVLPLYPAVEAGVNKAVPDNQQ